MENQQLTKIKIGIIFLFSLFISYLGWLLIQPSLDNGPMTILNYRQPVIALLVALALVTIGGIFGQFFGKVGQLFSRVGQQSLGLFGVPAALCFWILRSGGTDQLLVALPSVEQRTELFYRFILEAVLWTLVLWAGFGVVKVIARFKTSAADRDAISQIVFTTPKPRSGKAALLWENPRVKAVVGLLACCLIAVMLLKIFMQSEKTWTQGYLHFEVSHGPVKGQVLFALFASFYLATLAAKYLFRIPLGVLLAAPTLVAIASYFYVAHKHLPQDILDRAPEMILPSIRFGMALPIEFLGFGSLAVICGYWSQFHDGNQEGGW